MHIRSANLLDTRVSGGRILDMSQKVYLGRRLISLALFAILFSCFSLAVFAQTEPSPSDVSASDVLSGSDSTSDSDVPSSSDSEPPLEDSAPLLLVVMSTALEEGSTMSFSINSNGYVFVDWGNGATVPTEADPGQLSHISGKVQGSELKIYSTAAITNLVITRMALTSIDAKVASLDVCANRLNFGTLPLVSSFAGGYYYSPQSVVALPEDVVCGRTVDLSSCAVAYDQSGFAHYTEFRWLNSSGEPVSPSLEINGRFAFGDEFAGQTLRCEMRNEMFPELVLRTSYIKVIEHDPLAPKPQTNNTNQPAPTPQEEQRNTLTVYLAIAIGANLVLMGTLSAIDNAKKKKAKAKNNHFYQP